MTTAVGLITPEKIIKFFHISQKQMGELQEGSSIWRNILDCCSFKKWPEIWHGMDCSTQSCSWAPSRSTCAPWLVGGMETGWSVVSRQVSPWCAWLGWKDGCLSWRVLVKAKRVAWVSSSWPHVTDSVITGGTIHWQSMHTHGLMHAPFNSWILTPVYIDVSGSTKASAMPLQASSWYLESMHLSCWEDCPHERPQLDFYSFPWVQSQR